MTRLDLSDYTALAGLLLLTLALFLAWGVPPALAFVGLCLIVAGLLSARN